ncbi:MAG TPA: sensor histidine kinase, partial [Gaiellaceae bacterium]|nr:sensor histidine kinase [Gaiellaceae bacterium]
LAEDLLVLAATEDGDLPVRGAPVDARELMEEVADRFAARAQAAGRELRVRAARSVLHADRARLQQALGNLVDNALRHGAGRIVLDATAVGGCTVLSVSDEGPGFPPGFEGRAFERFSRGDEARSSGGAGLGLAIVDAVARAHGGEARARTRPEGGAEVALFLPSRLSLR